MNPWNEEYGQDRGPGPAGVLVLMGLALGAAVAFLLTTKQGQQVREQLLARVGDLPAQAADALAQGREKLIASVDGQAPPRPEAGPTVREKPV